MSVNVLMSNGAPVGLARAITGVGDNGTLTATGTTIADAAAIVAMSTQVTGASNAGVQLPNKEGIFFIGNVTNATKIYPHSASGTLNGGSAGAAVTVGAGKGAICVRQSALNWIVIGDAA